MNILASEHSQGIAKGFGIGLAVVVLAYAGFYGWVDINGPEVRKQRDSKLVSSTVVLDRVMPINPPIQKPIVHTTEAEQQTVMGPEQHAAEAHLEPAPMPAAKHTPEHPAPAIADKHKVAEETHATPAHGADDHHAAEVHSPAATADSHETPDAHATTPAAPAPLSAKEALDVQLKDVKKYSNGMCMAPVEGLYEDTPEGRLPTIRKDGLTPFKTYRKPVALSGNAPVISIAVSDMGLSQKITDSAIKSLPPEVTLIVSPYADGPDMWTNEARSNGHEVWMSLPMESVNYPKDDPGPYTLLVGAPERENLQKLNWIMSRAVGYAGLVVTYQPVFMDAQNDVRPVLGAIYQRGVGLIANGGAGSLPDSMALSMNAPYSSIDVWIDKPENTTDIIKASLQQLEVIARDKGFAAGVISPSSVSFRELQTWIETLNAKGIVLAPLSAQTGY